MNIEQMAQAYILNEIRRIGICAIDNKIILDAWSIAARMQAEADKRNKAEAEQKRKEMRELLNAENTCIEREGQHFDDVHFEVDWDLAPKNAVAWEMRESGCFKWFCNVDGGLDFAEAPSFGYTGDWRNSLRKRPEMEVERHG